VIDVGASGWMTSVPYQDDIARALNEARWAAFRAGDFYREEENTQARTMSEDEYVAWSMAGQPEGISDEAFRDEWRAGRMDPVDPDSLRASQPFSGTHSVIDVHTVDTEPGYFKVTPASDEVLMDIFGTLRPTAAQVGAAGDESHRFWPHRAWGGAYVVSYQDDVPHMIFFIGISGD
jgi:hypothetical protein